MLRSVEPGPCLSVHLRATTLMARTGQRFGEPLPRQQPDQPQPHPKACLQHAVNTFGHDTIPGHHTYRLLTPVSRGFLRP